MSITDVNEAGNSIKLLESHNYHQWSDLMLSYLLEHNLDGIIDGTVSQPTTPLESQNWLLRQKKAAGFIDRKLDSTNRDLLITNLSRRDPQALWNAIKSEYASKRARNRSRLFTKFLTLNCSDGDLTKFTSSFREIVREMTNTGIHLDDDLLAHMALHHLPSEYETTRQVMIASSESSNLALTMNGVLSQINELIKDKSANKPNHSALHTKHQPQSQNPHRSNLRYERCTNGRHNPKTANSENDCWKLNPHKSPFSSSRNPRAVAAPAKTASINGKALVALACHDNSSGKPILDSGASQTMFKERAAFTDYSPLMTRIEVANGDSIKGLGIGTVQVLHQDVPISLNQVLHVPALVKPGQLRGPRY